MQAGELIVARVGGNLSIATCLSVESTRARISLGRKKESRISVERIVFSTGISPQDAQGAEEFRQQCTALVAEIDLTEVWEVLRDEPDVLSLDDIADLYWGNVPSVAHKVALLFYLENGTPYFSSAKEGYSPRSEEDVQEILTRRQREAEHRQETGALTKSLSRGELPSDLTAYQQSLVDHLRGFAIHGDNYTRIELARDLVEAIAGATRDPQRRSFEILTDVGVISEDEPLELERAGIIEEFPEEAIEQAAMLDISALLSDPHRQDLTDLPTITIDDAGTQDKDDALSLEIENESDDDTIVYRVGIHIADAAALIPAGSALDQEADRRMATLYMPERNIVMVPEVLSSGLGSLLPGEKRAALSLMVRMSESGELLGTEVFRSVIRNDSALSYDEADGAISDSEHPWHHTLATLEKIARVLRQKREEAGAINLDKPEMHVKVSGAGEVTVRVVPRSTPSRQTVTELMILCNSLLAEFCRDNSIPAAYRSQASTDISDLAGMPEGPLRWYTTVRRLTPASLDTVPAHHGGLGVSAYVQVTSPLRRYTDLVLQRQMGHFIGTGTPFYSTEEIGLLARRADTQVRELNRIEEDRRRYWFLKYLREMSGLQRLQGKSMLFEAIVLENSDGRQAQLELVDYPFRVRAQLPSGCEPGTQVTLRLHGVDLWRKFGQFVHEP